MKFYYHKKQKPSSKAVEKYTEYMRSLVGANFPGVGTTYIVRGGFYYYIVYTPDTVWTGDEVISYLSVFDVYVKRGLIAIKKPFRALCFTTHLPVRVSGRRMRYSNVYLSEADRDFRLVLHFGDRLLG